MRRYSHSHVLYKFLHFHKDYLHTPLELKVAYNYMIVYDVFAGYSHIFAHWFPVKPSEQAQVLLATHAPFSHGGSQITVFRQEQMVYTCSYEHINNYMFQWYVSQEF